ncbi:DEAD/DEAH box helicase [Oxalobacteraceae bacterium]|nr:DEAD/DEAH box helicase [Oxalobacteraceae bacterium]
MADTNAKRKAIAEQLSRGLAAENRLTPEQARAFVRGLQVSWEVPPIQWQPSESSAQLADAQRLLHAAAVLREVEGVESSMAKDCYRRAAEILEWLSRAYDDLKIAVPVELLASAAYQLAGLSAMATGLLAQIESQEAGTRLYSRFLAGDFDGTVAEALKFWKENSELTKRANPLQILTPDEPESLEWYFATELVRCIGLMAATLRRGDDQRANRALQKLAALERLATRTFTSDISMLVGLMNAVAHGYFQSSIYRPLRGLALIKPTQSLRLERFGRGQFSRGRGILWTSQKQGLDRLLQQSSFALCTPTGSGKTLVANLAILKELLLVDDNIQMPLALYLVPSRALAGEVEAKLTHELGSDFIVTGLYGGADWGITDYWLQAERPTVLIATVEKAEALMRYVGPLLVARLRLLIIDEAHQVVSEDNPRARSDFADHSSRSLRLESFVSRLLARLPDLARIALTAVAGGAAVPVAKWIEGNSEAKPIGTRYRSTRQLIGVLEATSGHTGKMSVEMMNGAVLRVRGRQDPVYIPLRFTRMPTLRAQVRDSIYHFNELHVLWTALHLIDDGRRVLISVAQQPERTMRWFKEALELPEWSTALRFTLPNDSVDRGIFDAARAASVDYCGEVSYEVALLDCGIATSHGQMPQRLRRLMTQLIERRICPITIATATLTEGVNLPFDIIFVLSLRRRRYDPDAAPAERSTVTPMSTAEFRNLAGRAGRPGATKAMEGITLIALPTAPSTTAATKKSLQLKQIREMQQDYDDLFDNLRLEEADSGQVISPLSLLIVTIAERAQALLGVSETLFLAWLEQITPDEISDYAGGAHSDPLARLADSIDELDGILLTAVEEVAMVTGQEQSLADIETSLAQLWRRTFSQIAASQEAWLEYAFVQRGVGLVANVYPDPVERKRLFQYGFSPYIGRRFEAIAPAIRQVLSDAVNYGTLDVNQRLHYFVALVTLIASDRGFGLRARTTVGDQELFANWISPLSWLMNVPGALSPAPSELRAWQRFASDNFEFRLGTAIGAVVAQAWSQGTDEPFLVPSLEAWKSTTGLPWFGFWAKELLRWGTLDPFIAFVLAQGIEGTRAAAAGRRNEFEEWLNINSGIRESDDLIAPQNFIAWAGTLQITTAPPLPSPVVDVALSDGVGSLTQYDVLPIARSDSVQWIDPAGYLLATSRDLSIRSPHKDDFAIDRHGDQWRVQRIFRAG